MKKITLMKNCFLNENCNFVIVFIRGISRIAALRSEFGKVLIPPRSTRQPIESCAIIEKGLSLLLSTRQLIESCVDGAGRGGGGA